jgi:hypothetical protein
VADWECIRSTSYLYTITPLSNEDAAAFTADGFDVELHVDTGCADYTSATIDGFYSSQIPVWIAKYFSLPVPSSNRTHCVVWSDWASQAETEANHGMRLDTTYYYFPGNWVLDRSGYFTAQHAHALPNLMAAINVYQAVTDDR